MTHDAHGLTGTPIGRRGFLLAGLAGAVTVTAAGTTGLLVRASPSQAAEEFVLDVTGDYEIVDVQTGCEVRVTVRNGIRRIRANGLPNHATGTFPNRNNPNSIRAQSYDYSLPTDPEQTGKNEKYNVPQSFGIAINGVLFDPYAAEWWQRDRNSGWQYNAMGTGIDLGLDDNNAHVQPTGAYHYHGLPEGLVESLPERRHSPLIGWAGDGFPIYLNQGYKKWNRRSSGIKTLRSSYIVRGGQRPDGPGGDYDGTYEEDWRYKKRAGNLDRANGRFQKTPEFKKGTYCYIITPEYPAIPRRFVGEIAESFLHSGPSGTNGPPPR